MVIFTHLISMNNVLWILMLLWRTSSFMIYELCCKMRNIIPNLDIKLYLWEEKIRLVITLIKFSDTTCKEEEFWNTILQAGRGQILLTMPASTTWHINIQWYYCSKYQYTIQYTTYKHIIVQNSNLLYDKTLYCIVLCGAVF